MGRDRRSVPGPGKTREPLQSHAYESGDRNRSPGREGKQDIDSPFCILMMRQTHAGAAGRVVLSVDAF